MNDGDEDKPELTEAEIVALSASAPLRFTHAAQVFAAARGSLAELEALARGEIATLLHDGMPAPHELMFHTFDWHGEFNIMLFPDGKTLVVDLCEHEEGAMRTKGPFKGHRLSIPMPFSEDGE